MTKPLSHLSLSDLESVLDVSSCCLLTEMQNCVHTNMILHLFSGRDLGPLTVLLSSLHFQL